MEGIAGGPAALEFLRSKAAQFCLVTNTSRMSVTDIVQHLTALGYDISRQEIIAVPEIAVDQMNATLCSWFGVPASNMTTLFPNLGNFKSNSDIETAYLSLGTKNLI